MRLSEFDYELPEELIALRPVTPRRSARLLVSSPSGIVDDRMENLAAHLRPGDLLVFNDTKVIPARLFGERRRGEAVARIEATLIERRGPALWAALAKPGKRLAVGDRIVFRAPADGQADGAGVQGDELIAEVRAKGEGGVVELGFEIAGPALDAAVAAIGAMPLPPYIAARRAADERDLEDYQTIFARTPGAVAAPTAALHFDAPLMESLAARGVETVEVTLHVGAGTFLPVKSDDIAEHEMHAEYAEVSEAAAQKIAATRAAGGRVVAVGTTSLRVLESAVDPEGRVQPFADETRLFLKPGSPIRATDGLVTNFHLPRSTLLMLVAAFISHDRMKTVYFHAVREQYRFYSYGDASLLWP